MKRRILCGILVIFVVLIFGCTNQTETTTVTNPENLRVAEVALPGMFCQACAQSSKTAFESMPGVVDVSVDIGTKQGEVIYDASVISKEQLVQEGLIQSYDGKIITDQKYEN